jgi:hypothetical protein
MTETGQTHREQRVAANEMVFRAVNERIDDLAGRWGASEATFVCECGDSSCAERLDVSRDQYEELRSNPRHFAVMRGHELPDVEAVVGDLGGFLVVEKPDDVTLLARDDSPGGRTARQVAENESRFREANERIELTAGRMGLSDPIPFLCECSEETCTELVKLSLHDYEEVRADPAVFFVTPGHEAHSAPHGEVIARYDSHFVVRKIGKAAEIAEQINDQGFG